MSAYGWYKLVHGIREAKYVPTPTHHFTSPIRQRPTD